MNIELCLRITEPILKVEVGADALLGKDEVFAELANARREESTGIENLLVASYIICSKQNN